MPSSGLSIIGLAGVFSTDQPSPMNEPSHSSTASSIVFEPKPLIKSFNDITGRRFGFLTAIGYGGKIPNRNRGSLTRWWCRCECGNLKLVTRSNLTSGSTKSCGCKKSLLITRRHSTHSLSNTDEYHAWSAMKSRCFHAKNASFDRYGGRGISVYAPWVESFEAFLQDMGPRPSPDHSLDRINNDGNYEPSNCRWATRVQQSRNKSSNRMLTWNGVTDCLQGWSDRLSIPASILQSRVRLGWDTERILSTKAGVRVKRKSL